MKPFLLIVLLLSLLATGIFLNNKVIVVQIVIPEHLLPYYEWLISFPGLPSNPGLLAPENVPLFDIKEL